MKVAVLECEMEDLLALGRTARADADAAADAGDAREVQVNEALALAFAGAAQALQQAQVDLDRALLEAPAEPVCRECGLAVSRCDCVEELARRSPGARFLGGF